MKVKVFESYKIPEITKADFIQELIDNLTSQIL